MYFLIGVALLLVLAMPAKSTGVLAMATIGKFGAVCAFAIIYVQAAEIFPTVIRYAMYFIFTFGGRSLTTLTRDSTVVCILVQNEVFFKILKKPSLVQK